MNCTLDYVVNLRYDGIASPSKVGTGPARELLEIISFGAMVSQSRSLFIFSDSFLFSVLDLKIPFI